MRSIFWLFAAALTLGACKGDKDDEGDEESDADTDADDSGTDDSGAESDADTDADSDTDTDADSDADTDTDTDTDVDCSGTAPTLGKLTVENGSSGKDTKVKFNGSANDPDADLHEITFQFWWDEEIDGTVDTSGSPGASGDGVVTDNETGKPAEPCTVEDLTFFFNLTVDGTNVPHNTEVDFAMVLVDANDEASDPAYVTGWTPNEDGTDGGATK